MPKYLDRLHPSTKRYIEKHVLDKEGCADETFVPNVKAVNLRGKHVTKANTDTRVFYSLIRGINKARRSQLGEKINELHPSERHLQIRGIRADFINEVPPPVVMSLTDGLGSKGIQKLRETLNKLADE